MTVDDDDFDYILLIYLLLPYTHDNKLERSRCCELIESVQTQLILMQKVGVWNQSGITITTVSQKSGCDDHCRHQIPMSTMFIHWPCY